MKRICLIACCLAVALCAAAQTDFRHLTYEEALAAARQEKKMLFVDFYTSWCGPCKMMLKEVFPQPQVGDYLNSRFVCIKLDAEKEGKELAERHDVKAYPTFIGLDTDEKVVFTKVGGGSAGEFIAAIEQQLDPKKSPERMRERYAAGERTPELISTYVVWLKEEAYSKEDHTLNMQADEMVKDYFNGLKDADRLAEENFFIYENYTNALAEPAGRFLVERRNEFAPAVKERAAARIRQLVKYEIGGYLSCRTPYDRTEYEALKKVIADLGLNAGGEYTNAFRLIECHATGDLNAYLKLCEKLRPKFTESQLNTLASSFSAIINTEDTAIRQRASKFVRSLLPDLSTTQIYFTAMDLKKLEGGGH